MLENNRMIRVTNRDNGSVGYTIPDMGNLHRNFQSGESKEVTMEELRKLVWLPGGQYILENLKAKPEIFFTYFVYDDKKTGGKYVEKIGIVKKIDMVEQYVMLIDKTKIPVLEIINITGEIFNSMEDE